MHCLSQAEQRVLGCLIEKARTTPDYYPMRLNNLIAACNQKSNRDPVVDYDDADVEDAIEKLSDRSLVFRVYSHDVRGARFKHCADSELGVDPAEEAILCELLIRGAQTTGELRQRCARMHEFPSLAAVEETLDGMAGGSTPLVVRVPPPPGKKAAQWRHLLSPEEPEEPEASPAPAPAPAATPAATAPAALPGPPTVDEGALQALRDELVGEVAALREELQELRADQQRLDTDLTRLREDLGA